VNVSVRVNRPQAGGYNIRIPVVTADWDADATSGAASALAAAWLQKWKRLEKYSTT
jgi:hypothetical protein